jgi:5-oxoprolinase (ATP-hydrolysing) subunit A
MGMQQIDLNCDMGEGMDTDESILPFVSSANIACGYHAGDADTMKRTIDLALEHHVAIGAHPSYPDREHFGRRDLFGVTMDTEDLAHLFMNQLQVFKKICDQCGAIFHHVKLHGALYNRAAIDACVSEIICVSIRSFDPSLCLYGLSGSELIRQANSFGLSFRNEVFADRTYQENGQLTPRTEPGALIDDPDESVRQVMTLIAEGKVRTTSGQEIRLAADTVCIHGDGKHPVAFARLIHNGLLARGIVIQAF